MKGEESAKRLAKYVLMDAEIGAMSPEDVIEATADRDAILRDLRDYKALRKAVRKLWANELFEVPELPKEGFMGCYYVEYPIDEDGWPSTERVGLDRDEYEALAKALGIRK